MTTQNTLLPWTLGPIVVAGADAVGGEINLGRNWIFAIQAVWPGTITGNIGIAVSNDNVTYEPVPDSEQAVSGAGSFMWNYTAAGFRFARPYFDWASGSGTIVVKADAKGAVR